MEKNLKPFAFALASKQRNDNAADAKTENGKWTAQSDVAVAGCTYVRRVDDFTFGRLGGDGSIFC